MWGSRPARFRNTARAEPYRGSAGTAAISVTISMIAMSGRWGRPAMADLRRNISAKRRILAAPGIALALLGCGIAATIAVPPRPLLVWNASASAPMGLYRVGQIGRAHV